MKKLLLTLALMSNVLYGYPEFFQGKLGNGLRILVLPKQTYPNALVQVWYGVGSKDEIDGHTGLSHILEHMMFTGTKDTKDFTARVDQVGGSHNATTSYDYTNYYESVPPENIADFLRLEADRMQNLELTSDGIKNELKSIVEERMMRIDNNLSAKLYEQAMAALHMRGPYHHMIIGWMSDIKGTKTNDINDWYKKWYAPNNALLVVAGPVDANEIFKLANNYFGSIPAKTLPERTIRQDIALTTNINFTLSSKSFAGDTVVMSFLAPSLVAAANEKDCYALYLLACILVNGKNSILYHDLVDAGIANAVSSYYDMARQYNTNINFEFKLKSANNKAQALAKFFVNIKKIAKGDIDSELLKRTRAMITADDVFEQDDFMALVFSLAKYSIIGLEPENRFKFASKIAAVSKDDLKFVARKYLLSGMYSQQFMKGE